MGLNLPCAFPFPTNIQHKPHQTQTLNDSCKMFKQLSREIVMLKHVDVGELNMLR